MDALESNVESMFVQATPVEFAAGLQWYDLAHEQAQRMAAYCGVTVELSAKALAVLSPRTAWPVNLAIAWKVAAHWKAGGSASTFDMVGCRALPLNVGKSFAILSGDRDRLSGQKVTAFADNILYPSTSHEVTIDSWAYRIAWGLIGVTDEIGKNITSKRYQEVAAAYRMIAGLHGLLPLDVQAITWIVAHRLENRPL